MSNRAVFLTEQLQLRHGFEAAWAAQVTGEASMQGGCSCGMNLCC